MAREQLNGRDPMRQSAIESNSSFVSERSPLLRALREGSSSFEGTYMSMPPPSSMESRLSEVGQFQPIVYAEKALAALLTGVLLYAICCILGLMLVSLNAEGILGARVNWWLIFAPFWVANACMFVAHVQSIRHAKKLRQWAEVDSMSNEPLLPLLRRIVLLYAISIPLSVLLLWSELAFCARLENTGTSLYICYAPIMVIQVAFVVRYLLCRSDSTLPVQSSLLALVLNEQLPRSSNMSTDLVTYVSATCVALGRVLDPQLRLHGPARVPDRHAAQAPHARGDVPALVVDRARAALCV